MMNKYKAPWIIQDRKIRLGVVGCGRIAAKHFEAIKTHNKDLEIVAVCDVNQEALNQAVKLINCMGYSSLESLLEHSDADVIVICTPSGLHPVQTCIAAKAGRHVVTEKPMATNWQDGLKMVKTCDESATRLFVVKQNRMNKTLQKLKHAIVENRFEQIYLVNMNILWQRPQSYYDQAQWRGTWALDGGALMNQASHYIDLLYWLFGSVESVQAITSTLARNIEAEDTAVLNVKWRSGALGSLNVTMLTYPKNFEGSITVIGKKGTVRIGGVAANKIEHWEFEEIKDEDKYVQDTSYDTVSVYGFGHFQYYENVIKVLRGETSPETDGHEGLNSLEILMAAYLSAKKGQKITLPLEKNYEPVA